MKPRSHEPRTGAEAESAPRDPQSLGALSQLSDDQIAQLVRDGIRADLRLATSSIQVTANHGTIHLTGRVPNPEARAAAATIAQHTRGVTSLIDSIEVQPSMPRFDADITADVISEITLDTTANPAKIDVETVDGIVYLRGTVASPTERQAVDSTARAIIGVRDVVDDIDVEVAVPHPDQELLRVLRTRFDQLLSPEVTARLHVAVRHGIAYLQGEIADESLRWAIEDVARWTPGIVDVVDELRGPATP